MTEVPAAESAADSEFSDPGAEPTGYGLGRHGWVSVELAPDADEARWQQVTEWVRTSYTMVAPKKLARMVLEADGVVLASPVYVNDVSGHVKTLIDRLAFVCHRPQFMQTPFFLATTGGSSCRHALRTGNVSDSLRTDSIGRSSCNVAGARHSSRL